MIAGGGVRTQCVGPVGGIPQATLLEGAVLGVSVQRVCPSLWVWAHPNPCAQT